MSRFVSWLRARLGITHITYNIAEVGRSDPGLSRADLLLAMEQTRAVTIEMLRCTAAAPKVPTKSDDVVIKSLAASIDAAKKWDWRCASCRRDLSGPTPDTSRDVPAPLKSQGSEEKTPGSEGRPPPTEH